VQLGEMWSCIGCKPCQYGVAMCVAGIKVLAVQCMVARVGPYERIWGARMASGCTKISRSKRSWQSWGKTKGKTHTSALAGGASDRHLTYLCQLMDPG
jgi:hypothetical protein